MKIVYLLLHDFRFASVNLEEFVSSRFHFSKEYARRMSEMGHDVSLYILSDDVVGKKVIEVDGFEVKAFQPSLRFPPLMRFGNAHNLSVLREIASDSPDLVHLHNYYMWNFFYVAPWVKRRGTPLVAQFHGTDPIRKLKAMAFYPSIRSCDRILVPVKSEEDLLVRGLRIPGHRVKRFPSTGVDTQIFRRVRARDDQPLLLYVGRIPKPSSYRWEKAPQYLLPILKALIGAGVKARLVVVGDGPGLLSMTQTARNLGIQGSVEFLGSLDQAELPELYSRAWVTFVPMHMDELEPYWGGTVQESLACGTPVVAFNRESPGFGNYGLLVSPEAGTAAKLLRLALGDSSWISMAGDRGLEFVRQSCDWDVLSSRLDSIYEHLTIGNS